MRMGGLGQNPQSEGRTPPAALRELTGHRCSGGGGGSWRTCCGDLSCAEQLTAWTVKVSGGDPVGQRPPEPEVGEPGEWRHGWQYWSSSVSNSHFKKEVMLHGRRRAHLRSHSGFNADGALAHCPTAPENTIPPHLFRTLCLRGCSCHCKSLKRGVRVAMLFSTRWAA